jgi:hypothetical protein
LNKINKYIYNYILRYLIFIIIGILLYLLLNIYNTFSIGVPVTDLNKIFPDDDDKVSSDEDPFGAGIPRVFYNQGLRLRERFEAGRLYDVGWYYGNDTDRIFISAINIPILETIGTTDRPATAEVPTPTYINYNMYENYETLLLDGVTYNPTEIGTTDRPPIYYRLRNMGNDLLIYTLDDRIVISNIRHPDRRRYTNLADWCAAAIPEGIPPEREGDGS